MSDREIVFWALTVAAQERWQAWAVAYNHDQKASFIYYARRTLYSVRQTRRQATFRHLPG